ncbi:unnamed protein product [Prorocentrum cordatum]|uniref:Uncharacterized protein n=1 Tax=Prorocentrum cordatum TaxID=2364126 RepID=A0ABN9WW62_9DINO|nr:unnamed protein product [Polarella glacialis]
MYAAVDQAFYSFTPPRAERGPPRRGRERRPRAPQRVPLALRQQRRGPLPRRFHGELLGLSKISKFDHLVHYAGSYYLADLFNRALSSHVWRHGFQPDPFGATPGGRLRELLRGGSVVQTVEAITALCPGAGGFAAEAVPLDALVDTLGG